MLQAQAASLQPWEIIGISAAVLTAILTVYGGLIKANYDRTHTLYDRLLGTAGDETHEGFIKETEERFNSLEEKVESHAEETHTQLYHVDRKLNLLLEESSDFDDVDYDPHRVPPPESRDFLRGGTSSGAGDHTPPQPDGGRRHHYREEERSDGDG